MTDYEAAFRNLTDKWHESVKHYEDRIEKLERENNDIIIHFDGLVARIEKLEAALTPFLKLPIGVINDDPPEMEVYQCHGWPRDQLAVVTVADFWRVRKALEGKDD